MVAKSNLAVEFDSTQHSGVLTPICSGAVRECYFSRYFKCLLTIKGFGFENKEGERAGVVDL